jgi:protein ImuB
MLELLRERSEHLQLAAPVVAITLRVAHWQPLAEGSGELFERSRPAGDAQLLERLRARLGEGAVQGLQPVPDHRPERAWRFCPPVGGQQVRGARNEDRGPAVPRTSPLVPRPLWLLESPRPLAAPDGRPSYGGPLQLELLPERIEAGWWDGDEVARDYYLAYSPPGERLWVYRDRRTGRWYLHGLFD